MLILLIRCSFSYIIKIRYGSWAIQNIVNIVSRTDFYTVDTAGFMDNIIVIITVRCRYCPVNIVTAILFSKSTIVDETIIIGLYNCRT